jgi:hypothetical protein
MIVACTTGRPNRRSGSVVVWLIVCLGVIVGIVGLGMDGGRMMEERRRAQAAADAAALAAAKDLYAKNDQNRGTDPSGTARAAALACAAANGFSNDGKASAVTVHIPPTSGAFAGRAEYVEVIIRSDLNASFSAVFTKDPLRVQARAVARGRPKQIGLLLLQKGGSDSLTVTGQGGVEVVGAPIIVNSADSRAYRISRNATVSAPSHDLAGTLAGTEGNLIGKVNTKVPPTADPFRALPPPSPAKYPVRASSRTTIASDSVTLQPGVYEGGISISGAAKVTLAPGVYIVQDGGFRVSGDATVTGEGVLIYNTGGYGARSFTITGNGKVTLGPAIDGTYRGVSFFQDRALANPVSISGNAVLQMTGMVYAPAASVLVSGDGVVRTQDPNDPESDEDEKVVTDDELAKDAPPAGEVYVGGYIVQRMRVSGKASFRVDQGTTSAHAVEVGLVE